VKKEKQYKFEPWQHSDWPFGTNRMFYTLGHHDLGMMQRITKPWQDLWVDVVFGEAVHEYWVKIPHKNGNQKISPVTADTKGAKPVTVIREKWRSKP
jgi:hypothetical protein